MRILFYILCCQGFCQTLNAAVLPKFHLRQQLCTEEQYNLTLGIDTGYYDSVQVAYAELRYPTIWKHLSDRDAFQDMIEELPYYGVNNDQFNLEELNRLKYSSSFLDKIKREFLLTEYYLEYYKLTLNGTVQPEKRNGKFYYPEELMDAKALVFDLYNNLNLIQANNLSSNYQNTALHAEAKRLYQLIETEEFIVLPEREDSLSKGSRDSVILVLKTKLFQSQDLTTTQKLRSITFDTVVEDALMNYQFRNKLDPSGILDVPTIKKLNETWTAKWEQIIVDLERWRWLPSEMGNYYIETNIPSYLLQVYDSEELVFEKRIVVGKPTRATPSFYSQMTYLDMNPSWTVPPTILREDIVPNARVNPSYLNWKKITVYEKSSGAAMNLDSVKWGSYNNYRYVQQPGPSNALGKVKFIFPNQYYIFIHDTPTKTHFELEQRAYSSGCIRVEDPEELTKFILRDSDTYSASAIDDIFELTDTKRISLSDGPMVYVNYFTTTVDTFGRVIYHKDIYKYNKELLGNLYVMD